MDQASLREYFDLLAPKRDLWRRRNFYYHKTLINLCRFLIPDNSTVLEIGCGTGELLKSINPVRGVGIDISQKMVEIASKKYPSISWFVSNHENMPNLEDSFDYILMSDLVGYLEDMETDFCEIRRLCRSNTRLIITYSNYMWEPILKLAEFLHLKADQPIQNWISPQDLENILALSGFDVVKRGSKMIIPFYIPVISFLFNKVIANLPIISSLCLIQYLVARPTIIPKEGCSVSIVIPARNEKGNIENTIKRLPSFGSSQEVIFVEGHSSDGTLEEIKRVAGEYKNKEIRYTVQTGKGKGDAVRLGFNMAKGEILMILDADLTVPPEDLPKFYKAITSGKGEFINGSRLVYPLEKESMRFFNIIGNKFFSIMFSWILGQRIKDTLCGTKVLFRSDYEKIVSGRKFFGDFDPFGDFDLLFGAARLSLKIVELPIRYKARTYGDTNIRRWKHGWLLLKMTLFSIRKFRL